MDIKVCLIIGYSESVQSTSTGVKQEEIEMENLPSEVGYYNYLHCAI